MPVDRHDPANDTGFECTAYFSGRDGLGTCNTGCQWWTGACPKAKGSPVWDLQDERTDGQRCASEARIARARG